MKRQRFQTDRVSYGEFFDQPEEDGVALASVAVPKKENQIVAQVQEGDTLQAICLRYNCSLAELKRLNKIEKEIEIHARKTLRIPVTAFTVLLDTGLPGVHSSGNSSPKHAATAPSAQQLQLGNNPVLDEKLLIAAVSHSSSHVHGGGGLGGHSTINEIILESKITPSVPQYHDIDQQLADSSTSSHSRVPLLSGDMDENVPQPRPIPVRHRFEINFNNGTDCDMSWVCLFICILLLCVAIPLIYVFWTVEHVDHLHGAHGDDLLHALNSSTGHLGGHPPAAPLPPMKSVAE